MWTGTSLVGPFARTHFVCFCVPLVRHQGLRELSFKFSVCPVHAAANFNSSLTLLEWWGKRDKLNCVKSTVSSMTWFSTVFPNPRPEGLLPCMFQMSPSSSTSDSNDELLINSLQNSDNDLFIKIRCVGAGRRLKHARLGALGTRLGNTGL